MAYLLAIHRPKCDMCPKYATETLRHWQNHDLGTYCTRHSKFALARQQLKELEESKRAAERAGTVPHEPASLRRLVDVR